MESPELAGAGSYSPTSPVSAGGANGGGSHKRKRSTIGDISGIGSSPGSNGDDADGLDHSEKKRLPGVKRACNECRQQKLRCNVVQDPFQSCSRCIRLKLDCKIESNFKRVGKRSKHAEMEREIAGLRRALEDAQTQGYRVPDDRRDSLPQIHMSSQPQLQSPLANTANFSNAHPQMQADEIMGSPDEVVSSLLTLKRGIHAFPPQHQRKLDDFFVHPDMEMELFRIFFRHYHPYLPFLNPELTPEQSHELHPLLYWAIIVVAGRRQPSEHFYQRMEDPFKKYLWSTIGTVPQSHHYIKGLCLLCIWPLPTVLSSTDPTHILCGVMMKAATGIGLHRPNYINDFSRDKVELNKDQVHDRVMTWAVCNIVAQTVGTGYGQPASTLYDWTLAARPGQSGPFSLTPDLEARLQIERFCDKVSKEMYSNASDPRGVAGDEHRTILMRVYRREYNELQAAILSRGLSPFVNIHLKAAGLHLRLATFYDASTSPRYIDDLAGLWRAITGFLDYVLDGYLMDLKDDIGQVPRLDQVPRMDEHPLVRYAPNYIQQIMVAAGFALLKLMRSFFSNHIDIDRGRSLFHRTVDAIRISTVSNAELHCRLVELMVQIWNNTRPDLKQPYLDDDGAPVPVDDSLQLKVRCRHSMSLVFDTIWMWREEYQARGRGSLDTIINHPTLPDSANVSSVSSAHLDAGMMQSMQPPPQPQHMMPTTLPGGLSSIMTNGGLTPNGLVGQMPPPLPQNNGAFMGFDLNNDIWPWHMNDLLLFDPPGSSNDGGPMMTMTALESI